MKDWIFSFSAEKNAQLIARRGISFEKIINAIENDGVLDVLEHPNKEKYPKQKIYVVKWNGYAYLVPFVDEGKNIFLKTAFPDRKATKHYLTHRGVK